MFSEEFLRFFRELAPNNNKEWFDLNRSRYEQFVKEPFQIFVQELLAELKKEDSLLKDLEAKTCIFRINKDVRFSKDKTPYKLHMAAAFAPDGKKDFINPGLYVEINPEHVRLYGGVYQPDKWCLERIRRYMLHHELAFNKALEDKGFQTFWNGAILGERNKVVATEFKEASLRNAYLLNKQFYYQSDLNADAILEPDFIEQLMHRYRAAKPMNAFFRKAVLEG